MKQLMKRVVLVWILVASHRTWRLLMPAFSTTLPLSPLLFRPVFTDGPNVGFHIHYAQRYANEVPNGTWYPHWLGDWLVDMAHQLGDLPLLYWTRSQGIF